MESLIIVLLGLLKMVLFFGLGIIIIGISLLTIQLISYRIFNINLYNKLNKVLYN